MRTNTSKLIHIIKRLCSAQYLEDAIIASQSMKELHRNSALVKNITKAFTLALNWVPSNRVIETYSRRQKQALACTLDNYFSLVAKYHIATTQGENIKKLMSALSHLTQHGAKAMVYLQYCVLTKEIQKFNSQPNLQNLAGFIIQLHQNCQGIPFAKYSIHNMLRFASMHTGKDHSIHPIEYSELIPHYVQPKDIYYLNIAINKYALIATPKAFQTFLYTAHLRQVDLRKRSTYAVAVRPMTYMAYHTQPAPYYHSRLSMPNTQQPAWDQNPATPQQTWYHGATIPQPQIWQAAAKAEHAISYHNSHRMQQKNTHADDYAVRVSQSKALEKKQTHNRLSPQSITSVSCLTRDHQSRDFNGRKPTDSEIDGMMNALLDVVDGQKL